MFDSEFRLELDGEISGPDRANSGRKLITHSLFVEENLSEFELINIFDTYYKLALQAIIKRTKTTLVPNTAWNVMVQSVPYINNNQDGILYCILAEIEDEAHEF